jgi:hypothetical protein
MMQGRPVRIELNSADISSAAELNIYDWDGNAVTLGANERLAIQTLTIYAEQNTAPVVVFADSDDDNVVDNGERMAVAGVGTSTVWYYPHAMFGERGIVPHVIAAGGSGVVTIVGVGYIVEDRTETLGNHPSWDTRA